jgi:hypothetical protein
MTPACMMCGNPSLLIPELLRKQYPILLMNIIQHLQAVILKLLEVYPMVVTNLNCLLVHSFKHVYRISLFLCLQTLIEINPLCLHMKDKNRKSTFQNACYIGRIDVVKMSLLCPGIHINEWDEMDQTEFHFVLDLVLMDSGGWYPLTKSHLRVVEVLVHHSLPDSV